MKNRLRLFLIVSIVALMALVPAMPASANWWGKNILRVGWAIGWDESNTAVILHTRNGGRKWVAQGDNTNWEGFPGNDISAVDRHTAWAALGEAEGTGGIILHTTNGGKTWTEQALPEGVDGGIKGIKGLSRREAWAVSYNGTILHTTDGGKVWDVVDSGIVMGRVNRIDAIGYRDLRDAVFLGRNRGMIHANVWIADDDNQYPGPQWGMIHTLYNGDIWRQENVPFEVPGSGVHMVSAYSPRVVWAAAWFDGNLYRTMDGGEKWESVGKIGPNDIDDMCAYHADKVWLVQFQSSPTGGGIIYHVRLEDGQFYADDFTPELDYRYEGLTCANDQAAVVVGYTDSDDPSLQRGIILATKNGGKSWERQPVPVDGVRLWKVSFVGAQR